MKLYPPGYTPLYSSAASEVYTGQVKYRDTGRQHRQPAWTTAQDACYNIYVCTSHQALLHTPRTTAELLNRTVLTCRLIAGHIGDLPCDWYSCISITTCMVTDKDQGERVAVVYVHVYIHYKSYG